MTGEMASETRFKECCNRYGILHFFVHGREDKANPSVSNLYLVSDSTNDGYLYAWEVSNLTVDADLVVLASCYSGSGKVSEGEGVLSIGRSFANAGAKSLIVSLWNAPVGTGC
ncbi:MAG: CHAT domain-containing protein [Bacteroidales bacterium]|nr:CHAT domain-containing protein [Bacteroidales bacterium]